MQGLCYGHYILLYDPCSLRLPAILIVAHVGARDLWFGSMSLLILFEMTARDAAEALISIHAAKGMPEHRQDGRRCSCSFRG